MKTLDTLLLPTAKIKNVDPDYAQHYQDVLYQAKSQKLMVSLSSFVAFKFTEWLGEGAGREDLLYSFFLKLMSCLSQPLPMDPNGNNRAFFTLVSNINRKMAPELITTSALTKNSSLVKFMFRVQVIGYLLSTYCVHSTVYSIWLGGRGYDTKNI